MPIPLPKANEVKEDYLKRCIGFLVKEGKEQDQAVAICQQNWEKKEAPNDELKDKVEKYKKGKGEMPTITFKGETKAENGELKMILSKEIIDRDGELVDIGGMNIENFIKNPVLIDAHQLTGSVVDNVLGRVKNIIKTKDVDGIKMLTGTPEFAPSPNGQIAKSLVENGFARTVSVGFGVKDYDHESRTITESELYEVSLVSVPSNVQAIISKGLNMNKEDNVAEKLEATLNNYKDIHTKIKAYRSLFMSKELFDVMQIEKSGDEVLDLKRLYDKLILRLKEETPQEQPSEQAETPPSEQPKEAEPKVEIPKQEVPKEDLIIISKDDLQELVRDIIRDSLNS